MSETHSVVRLAVEVKLDSYGGYGDSYGVSAVFMIISQVRTAGVMIPWGGLLLYSVSLNSQLTLG